MRGGRNALLVLVLGWLVVRLAFLAWVGGYLAPLVPGRAPERQPRARGECLAELVPAGAPLYLFRLKDEGVLFYYGRPTRRLAGAQHLPRGDGPLYCLLVEEEWRCWPDGCGAEVVGRLTDEQGAALVLVKAHARPESVP